jgi:hypothetical protein
MMRINQTGVGIGGNWGSYGTVTDPAYPLHVQGTASATQYNRGAIEMGRIIIHDQPTTNQNYSISNTQTTWTDAITKSVTPQSAKSYFWVEMYHNEHINMTTPNYGGGLRLMGDSTEIARSGEMIYVTAAANTNHYNGNAKTWGSWYNPGATGTIAFKAQVTGVNGGNGNGNNYYWHWASGYIINPMGPRLRIVEFC